MIPRRVRALVLLAVVAAFSVVLPVQRPTVTEAAPAQQQAGPYRHFPETGHNIMFEVKTFYETRGGLETFGLPLTAAQRRRGLWQERHAERQAHGRQRDLRRLRSRQADPPRHLPARPREADVGGAGGGSWRRELP